MQTSGCCHANGQVTPTTKSPSCIGSGADYAPWTRQSEAHRRSDDGEPFLRSHAGALKARDPRIDGITDQSTNPDPTGAQIKAQPLAEFQGQLDPDPDHHFPAVDLQIFDGDTTAGRAPTMQGFIKSYFNQQRNVPHSQKIMYYFTPDKLPVLTTLATEFAVFNRWFASIPGPTICNRAFAHYGTSFGRVDMNLLYVNEPFKSIYNRLISANPKHTAKLYYYDQTSSTMEITNLLQSQPELFGTFQQFLDDCDKGDLPDYSFVEPNYSDHDSDVGEELASDQHPDHNIQAGEQFIASAYNAIKQNADLWKSTACACLQFSSRPGFRKARSWMGESSNMPRSPRQSRNSSWETIPRARRGKRVLRFSWSRPLNPTTPTIFFRLR